MTYLIALENQSLNVTREDPLKIEKHSNFEIDVDESLSDSNCPYALSVIMVLPKAQNHDRGV